MIQATSNSPRRRGNPETPPRESAFSALKPIAQRRTTQGWRITRIELDAQKPNDMDLERQNAIFDSALDFAMVVTDTEGLITAWNRGAERVMGWRQGEL